MTSSNPLPIIEKMEAQIAELIKQGVDRAHACVFEGEIAIRPRDHTKANHQILRTFSSEELNHGLPVRSWNRLQNQIAKVLQGATKCPDPQKPSQSKKLTPSLMP